jgi:hypothetical protein
MLRDVLVHFSFIDIFRVLSNITNGNIDYLLTTHFTSETANRDIPTGSWRRLNFLLPPFDFPSPLEMIVSYSEPYNDANGIRQQDKTLALWRIGDIKG